MYSIPIRTVIWIISIGGLSAAFGAGWMTQSVDMPLYAVLILTFIPTLELIDWVRSYVERRSKKQLTVTELEDLIAERKNEKEEVEGTENKR